jgi:DNA-binding IclR family transcriptional regulator
MATTAPKKTPASRNPKKAVDRQFVTALARGMAVLRCFDALRPQLGTTEIAQLTKLPQPTVWRLCYTLQQLGYLVPAPNSDKLCVGMAVLGLGQYALGSTDIGEMVLPEMIQIAKLTGAAVSLGIADQDDILIVKRAQGDGPLLMNMAVGSRLPIATSSAGWAWLAALSEEARDEALRKLKHQYSGKWSELRAAVELAAKNLGINGYVLNEGFYHPDVNAVGAPACDKTGKPQYVVTCGGPLLKLRFMRDEVGPQIARLARKITVALAGRPARAD